MVAVVTFFASLSGILILFCFKIFELKRGVKPFSVHRYKFDAVLRNKVEHATGFIKYANFETGKLLVLFIISELKDFAIVILRKLEDSKIGETVRGRNIPKGNGNGTNSAFLKGMSEMNGEVKKEEEVVE